MDTRRRRLGHTARAAFLIIFEGKIPGAKLASSRTRLVSNHGERKLRLAPRPMAMVGVDDGCGITRRPRHSSLRTWLGCRDRMRELASNVASEHNFVSRSASSLWTTILRGQSKERVCGRARERLFVLPTSLGDPYAFSWSHQPSSEPGTRFRRP